MTDSEKLDLLLAEIQGIKGDTQELKEKVSVIETKVTEISLTLENEIRTNIKRVAEGHLDLSRQFEITTKLDNEKEMLAIRVSMLETEMRRLRQQLNQMAG